MPATHDGFQLTDGDIQLLHAVHRVRLATIQHLVELSERSYTRTHKRVLKLTERHYLSCLTRRPQKHVYTIGPEAVPILIEHGFAPRDLANKRIRNAELKEIFIKHSLFISDIHVRLLRLTRTGPIAITNWTEGPALWDSVQTRDEEGKETGIPVRPDAWLTLHHAGLGKKFHFFIEADRGTMSHHRMREKVRGYLAYFQQQKHAKKYPGMKLFQVATVTETKGRATELADTFRGMMDPAWLPAYPVIPFEELTLSALVPVSGESTA